MQEQPQVPRGSFFKKFITEKLRFEDVNVARVDLVFDNKKLIDLLRRRGNAIKWQDATQIQEIEKEIEHHKQF